MTQNDDRTEFVVVNTATGKSFLLEYNGSGLMLEATAEGEEFSLADVLEVLVIVAQEDQKIAGNRVRLGRNMGKVMSAAGFPTWPGVDNVLAALRDAALRCE